MEQRNLLLAIVLSVGILIASQFLLERLRPPAPPPAPPAPVTQTTPAPAATAPGVAVPGPAAAGAPAKGPETREAALAEQKRVKINTPRLHGSIALTGGRIDDLALATYHETPDPKSPEVVLLWPTGTKEPYFAEFGWVAGAGSPGIKLPNQNTLWTASEGPLRAAHPVTLTWDNGAGLVFTRSVAVDDNYMFTIRDSVRNTG